MAEYKSGIRRTYTVLQCFHHTIRLNDNYPEQETTDQTNMGCVFSLCIDDLQQELYREKIKCQSDIKIVYTVKVSSDQVDNYIHEFI